MNKRPWKIDERRAPSPRAYLSYVAEIMRRWRRVIKRTLLTAAAADATTPEDERAAELEAARRRERMLEALRRMKLPPPPPPQRLEITLEPAYRQSARTARAEMLNVGVSRDQLSSGLGVPSETLIGIDVAPSVAEQAILREWAKVGTDLIVSVGQDLVAGLETAVAEAARSGASTASLARAVEDQLGVADRHAQFIARDQIAKLNGKITKSTHEAAGVMEYRWRASRDSRTRPAHRALDNTIHRWDEPPIVDAATGRREHPGGDYQCRCVAVPIIGDEDDEDAQPIKRPERKPSEPTPRDRAPRERVEAPPTLPAARLPTTEAKRAAFLDEWVHGSKRKASIALKKAVQAEFGVGGTVFQTRAFSLARADIRAAREAARLQFELTQAELKRRNVQKITLYRGVQSEYVGQGAIESWTTDLSIATRFAGPTGKVMRQEFEASQILAYSGGPGWKNGRFGEQFEWMVMPKGAR